MRTKLQCVIIDDDIHIHTEIKEFLWNFNKAVVVRCFKKCSDFLSAINDISFDLVFLDCIFPNDNKRGIDVAFKLKKIKKSFIFISGVNEDFVNTCRTIGAFDVMLKPLTKKRLRESVNRAFQSITLSRSRAKKQILIRVKEHKGEIPVSIEDMLYVRPDREDPRNKVVRMRNNVNYTFMDYTFPELLSFSSDFAMSNKSELVSYEIVIGVDGEDIKLSQKENCKIPRAIPLSPKFREKFKERFDNEM